MAEKSVEQKTREIAGKKTQKGNEHKDFQAAQNQLLEIQAEQKQNLQAQRLEDAAVTGKNQILAQAATLAGDMAASGGSAQAVPAQFTPATQGVLNKYGLNKPQIKKSSKTDKQVITKQNVVVNNTTTNNTTTVSQPGGIGPTQGRALAFKPNNIQFKAPQAKDSGLGKFKNWISNIFAKQDQDNAARKRDYDRRERDLSRSHGKILKKLESMAQEFGERFDPRKIGSTVSSQMKMLGFLFGFQWLSDNWASVLDMVGTIEQGVKDIVHWLGFGQQEGQSGLSRLLIRVLGGEPDKDKSAWEALKKLFVDENEGILPIIKDYFRLWAKERSDAIKEIKFPDLPDDGNMLDILKGFGIYLGDILSALISGKDAVMSSLEAGISRDSNTEMINGHGWKNTDAVKRFSETDDKITDANGKTLDDTSYGDAALEVDWGGHQKQNVLNKEDFTSNGDLANNTAAGIKQSRAITSMVQDINSGKVHTSKVITGFRNLRTAAERYGSVLVDPEFVEKLGRALGLNSSSDWEDFEKAIRGSVVNYKYIQTQKTADDYRNEGANVGETFILGAAGNSIVHQVTDNSGIPGSGLAGKWASFKTGWGIAKSAGKALVADKNILKLVPESDPRPAVSLNGRRTPYPYIPLKKSTIDDLIDRIGKAAGAANDANGKSTFKMSNLDENSVNLLDKYLKNKTKDQIKVRSKELKDEIGALDNAAKINTPTSNGYMAMGAAMQGKNANPNAAGELRTKASQKRSELNNIQRNLKNLGSDSEGYIDAREKAKVIDQQYTEEHKELNKKFKKSRLVKGAENTVGIVQDAAGSVWNMFNSAVNSISANGITDIFNWNDKGGGDYRVNRGKRNNNPGNRKGIDKYFGSGIDDDKFTRYDDLAHGYAGNTLLLANYLTEGHQFNHPISHHPPTIREIITEWCPPDGYGNSAASTNQYIEGVANDTGLGTDTPIPITKRNLLLIELSKGNHDSGIINKEAAFAGVNMFWNLMGWPDDGTLNGVASMEELVEMNRKETGKDKGVEASAGGERKDVPGQEGGDIDIKNIQAAAKKQQNEQKFSFGFGSFMNSGTAGTASGKNNLTSTQQNTSNPSGNTTTPFWQLGNNQQNQYNGPLLSTKNATTSTGNNQQSVTTPIDTVTPLKPAESLPVDYTAGFAASKTDTKGADTQAVALMTNKVEENNPKQEIAITQFTYTPTALPKTEIWNPAKLMPEFQKLVKDDDKRMAEIMNKLGLVMNDEVELSKKNLVATARIVDAVNNVSQGNNEVVNDVDTSYTPSYNVGSFSRTGIG